MARSRPAPDGSGTGIYKTPRLEIELPSGGVQHFPAEPDKGWEYNQFEDRLALRRQALERCSPKLRAVGDKMIAETEGGPVSSAIQKVADNHPEWFPTGYTGIHAVANRKFFAATSSDAIYLSDADDLVPGFKPASELASAVLKRQIAKALSFTEEYG